MRHKKSNKTLTANTNYNSALLYNLVKSLVEHKRVKTTLTRAKALRSHIEKLITIARKENFENSDFFSLQKKLQSNQTLIKDLREVSRQYADRPGGYVRVLKLGNRLGDNAKKALIEFV